MFDDYNDILTVDDIAKMLRVSKQTIRSLIRKGDLKCFKIGSEYRVLKKNLIEYLLR